MRLISLSFEPLMCLGDDDIDAMDLDELTLNPVHVHSPELSNSASPESEEGLEFDEGPSFSPSSPA